MGGLPLGPGRMHFKPPPYLQTRAAPAVRDELSRVTHAKARPMRFLTSLLARTRALPLLFGGLLLAPLPAAAQSTGSVKGTGASSSPPKDRQSTRLNSSHQIIS